jgi:Polysaccharide pyruvyl transferase.
MVKYGLLTYRTENIGDEIQSIAARQFLPRVDIYVERDSLNKVVSDEKIKLIINGWFTHKPENWPPSPDIEPLFISFHITPSAAQQLSSPQSIKYFKQHEPIGCRDYYTVNLLKKEGVDAYFSGCLTLTLQNTIKKRTNKILLVDIDLEDENIIESLPQQLTQKASFITRSSVFPNIKKMRELFQYKFRTFYHIIRRVHINYAALRFLAFLAKMRSGEKSSKKLKSSSRDIRKQNW